MKTVHQYFEEYSTYHTTKGNQLTHTVGIPLIVVSLLGLLSGVGYGPLNFGVLLLLGAILFYLVLDLRMALLFAPLLMVSYFVGKVLGSPINWVLFIAGWVFQGVGHYVYEKRAPAFMTNLEHLFIGPLWVFSKVTGIRPKQNLN